VHAVDDVTIDLFPGEVHALVGGNGAGKSTLIKTLSGAQRDLCVSAAPREPFKTLLG
jgi:ABC-type sugar transport system ATPase subunit